MNRVQDKRSFDWAGRQLGKLAAYYPRSAYLLADLLGAARNRVTGRWPKVNEIRALYPQFEDREAARVARRVGALYERNRVLVHSILRHGIGPSRNLISASDAFLSMHGPKILATFHVGAVHGFGPALERLRSPVMAFRSGPIYEPAGSLQILSTEGNEQLRASALYRALLHLRGGGIVFLALDDDADGHTIETECLGHRLRIAAGAFALARWTGAPIQLAVARWKGHRVAIDIHDAPGTAGGAAGWLERYLRDNSSEITLGLLRNLLGVS